MASEPEYEPVGRPGYGTSGQNISVYCNTYEVRHPVLTLYHYDVKMQGGSERMPAVVFRRVWMHMSNEMNVFNGAAVVYDGRAMAYSPIKLPYDGGSKEFEVNLPDETGRTSRKGDIFKVTVSFIRPIDLGTLSKFVRDAGRPDIGDLYSALQALNVIVQHGPMVTFPSRKDTFYIPPGNPQDRRAASISRGLEMWRGYYTSLRLGTGKIFVNLDVTSQPFIKPGNLPAVISEYANTRAKPFSERDIARIHPSVTIQINRFLKSGRIRINVPDAQGNLPRRKIKEITRESARDFTFEVEGVKTNVADYFKSQYGITLQHPEWPCVKVSKFASYPLELCELLEGQRYTRKLDPMQTADGLKFACVRPNQRIDLLKRGLGAIQPTNAASALTQWKLDISTEPMKVDARVLRPPGINFQSRVSPRDGVYDLRGLQFYEPKAVGHWLVFIFDSPRGFSTQDAQRSITGLIQSLRTLGMTVTNAQPHIEHAPPGIPPARIPDFIKETNRRYSPGLKPSLIVAYLARKPCDEYATIKRFGDCEAGIATQCLSIPKAQRGNPQYYSNVAMKVNVKLGGTNSYLDKVNLGPLATICSMVIGADVYHGPPGSLAPSIAAVVGSMDSKVTKYATAMKVQRSRLEIISDLDQMVCDLLLQFKERNQRKPDSIIFFRDGVSEGQFEQVLAKEVYSIRLGFQRFDPNYKPKLTYVVCGKRHHISFTPTNPSLGDKNGNVKAGTVVDRAIVHPFQFDWYTQSHATLLGTGRSAHYTVLVDDSNFSADTLQEMVYNLCYTYARCTRSVSYVTPAYYADRVCTRAALLLNYGFDDSATNVSTKSGDSDDRLKQAMLAEHTDRLKAIHQNLQESLYFL